MTKPRKLEISPEARYQMAALGKEHSDEMAAALVRITEDPEGLRDDVIRIPWDEWSAANPEIADRICQQLGGHPEMVIVKRDG